MSNVLIRVQEHASKVVTLTAPSDMNLSLMEFLKANGYEQIEAVCGGMALCGSCHVKILASEDEQETAIIANDEELDMLLSIPSSDETSRLSCQMRITEKLNNVLIKIVE